MNRNTRIVLIIVGSVLAVCCLGGVGGGLWLYRSYQNNAGPAREATAAFIDDIKAGNYEGAYGRLCKQVRASTSQEQFTRTQSAQPKITDYRITGTSVTNRNGRVSAEISVHLVQETGAELSQVVSLVKENDQWRVC